MTRTRWDPLNTVKPLRDTIDRVFEDFFNRPRRYFVPVCRQAGLTA